MTTIHLPNLPGGKEFEDYISAFFQSAGYYIERNIIERDVLELDIITKDYDLSRPEIKMLEVKSGDWGFGDIFKVLGWMRYLRIYKGLFIVSKEKDNIDFCKQKAKELNIDLIVVSDFSNTREAREALSELIGNKSIEDIDIQIWRYSYWVERNLKKDLIDKKKTNSNEKRFKALADYYFKVNNEIFFTKEITRKVNSLYSTFQEFPHISAKCGNELVGNNFDDECYRLPDQVYDDTYYKCNYNDIQISTFIEHRARLAILKNAVDWKLYKKPNIVKYLNELIKTKSPPEFIKHYLPSSFTEGLNTISKHKYFHKYPIFWQWFMWVFGGFILKDYEEKEYEILSKKTGVPVDEIQNAIESYQILFPRNDGWFINLSPNSEIKMMKMFPVPFMGVGACYRKVLYTESRKFKDLELTGEHTLEDLIKWNNLAVKVLKLN